MPKPAAIIGKGVTSYSRGLDSYLKKMENLYARGGLRIKDVERAYAGAFLEFHAHVEKCIGQLFVGLLRRRLVSSDHSVRPLISVSSDVVALAVTRGTRSYVDWFPYKNFTVKRAQAFFSSGKPFSSLDSADLSALEDIVLIRNALAHHSAVALRQFRKKLVDDKHLPPNEQRPEAYLRGIHTSGQTRMNYLLSRIAAIMATLSR